MSPFQRQACLSVIVTPHLCCRGLLPTVAGVTPYGAIAFAANDTCKETVRLVTMTVVADPVVASNPLTRPLIVRCGRSRERTPRRSTK